jgi:hypothetical protein
MNVAWLTTAGGHLPSNMQPRGKGVRSFIFSFVQIIRGSFHLSINIGNAQFVIEPVVFAMPGNNGPAHSGESRPNTRAIKSKRPLHCHGGRRSKARAAKARQDTQESQTDPIMPDVAASWMSAPTFSERSASNLSVYSQNHFNNVAHLLNERESVRAFQLTDDNPSKGVRTRMDRVHSAFTCRTLTRRRNWPHGNRTASNRGSEHARDICGYGRLCVGCRLCIRANDAHQSLFLFDHSHHSVFLFNQPQQPLLFFDQPNQSLLLRER